MFWQCSSGYFYVYRMLPFGVINDYFHIFLFDVAGLCRKCLRVITACLMPESTESEYAPEKVSTDGAHLQHPAGQRFSLHQRRRTSQLVHFNKLTGDPGRGAGSTRWNDDPHAGMAAAVQRSASRVHDKTHQKTVNDNKSPIALLIWLTLLIIIITTTIFIVLSS